MEPRGLACWYFALKSDLTFLSVPCLAGHEWCQAGSVTDPLTWDDLVLCLHWGCHQSPGKKGGTCTWRHER